MMAAQPCTKPRTEPNRTEPDQTTVMLLLISCYVYTICKYRRDGDGDGDGDGDAEGCFIPAAGVMQTRPVVMPCTAPITDGFPKKIMSRDIQTRRLVAVQTWVLRIAMDALTLAAKALPPLKPDHPSHRRPAPARVIRMLLGGKLSLSFFSRGPTCTRPKKCSLQCTHTLPQGLG